jgi:hypothetical protein
VPQTPRNNIDPEFWDRLRKTLQEHMKANKIRQKELALKLAIKPGTLNNFLNGQNRTLGGFAVAAACTLVDLVCDGRRIGRVGSNDLPETPTENQLVLEFDEAFELKREDGRPTMVLRKPPARDARLRLAVKRIG